MFILGVAIAGLILSLTVWLAVWLDPRSKAQRQLDKAARTIKQDDLLPDWGGFNGPGQLGGTSLLQALGRQYSPRR